jgi:hypothetical protein
MSKTYKVAIIVGNPKVNDMSDNAVALLNRIATIRDSGRFERMFIMPADKAPRIAAKAHFEAADVIVSVTAGTRRSCRTAAKAVALPMLYWNVYANRLARDDEERDVPEVGAALMAGQVQRLRDGECVVCGARDEYDFDIGNERWGCMACGAEFSLVLGERDRVKSAKRAKDFEDQVADAEAGDWNV